MTELWWTLLLWQFLLVFKGGIYKALLQQECKVTHINFYSIIEFFVKVGMDLIESLMITTTNHRYVIVATFYFTK